MGKMKKHIIFFVIYFLIFISIISPWVSSEIHLSSEPHNIKLTVNGYKILWGQVSIGLSIATMLFYIFRYKKLSMVVNFFMIALAAYFYFSGAGGIEWELNTRTIPVIGSFSFGFYFYSISSVILFISTWLSYKKEQENYDTTNSSYSTPNKEYKVDDNISPN
jgi:hypothetical protein